MRAMIVPLRAPFIDHLMARFSAIWPEKTSQLGHRYRPFIESGVERAVTYRLLTESSIARFVNLYFVWGDEFEVLPEHAWALEILRDHRLAENIKISELVSRTKLKLTAIHASQRQHL